MGTGGVRRSGRFARTGVSFNLSQGYAFIQWPHTPVNVKLRKCRGELRKNTRVLSTGEGAGMILSCRLSLQSEKESPDSTCKPQWQVL